MSPTNADFAIMELQVFTMLAYKVRADSPMHERTLALYMCNGGHVDLRTQPEDQRHPHSALSKVILENKVVGYRDDGKYTPARYTK